MKEYHAPPIIETFVKGIKNIGAAKKREKEILKLNAHQGIIYIWPGYVPEEKAQRAMKKIEETIGFKPRKIYEPSRLNITNQPTLAYHYLHETMHLIEENRNDVSGIVITDITTKSGEQVVTKEFLADIKNMARQFLVTVYYIPAKKLYGSDNQNLTKECKMLGDIRIRQATLRRLEVLKI